MPEIEHKTTSLGHGSYNNVTKIYAPRDKDDPFPWKVFKERRHNDILSEANRAVRKWNEFNPIFPAWVVDGDWSCQYLGRIVLGGWVAPYLGNVPANDEQIALKVVDIYRNTRNIVADACGLMNFLFYEGNAVCIDVDLACKMKRQSFASDDMFENCFGIGEMGQYWKKCGVFKPKTVEIIKTLFFLEDCLNVTQIDNAFLTPEIIGIFNEYRKLNVRILPYNINKLCEQFNIDFRLDDPASLLQANLGIFAAKNVLMQFQPTTHRPFYA